ncbi:MAG: hypothetical protein CMJ18_05900 [Phycisphaeraceae bacterium]|nr:hypothetical protein [Phycisphaeraceae bacterium]
MVTVSYDGQSLIIDGRRIWLVSGSIHYARIPRDLWRRRIRAARQAGLNCIDTSVCWNLHEPTRKKFNFKGDADLAAFIKLVGEEGMYCILRPGPFIDAHWDGGGLPDWLALAEGVRMRESNGPFLEASARFLGAVMDQVKSLQVTSSKRGPIVLMQAEHQWCCRYPNPNPGRIPDYLREITRYLRENGCAVPVLMSNNLWQSVDTTIDTWSGQDHLAADLRQLRVVRPESPRLVIGYRSGTCDHWGEKSRPNRDPAQVEVDLGMILASGAQYNLEPFHGGTNLGFTAGRSVGVDDPAMNMSDATAEAVGSGFSDNGASGSWFVTTSYDCGAPLSEGGGRGATYDAVKRISTFANEFGEVFAHLDPDPTHVTIMPSGDHPVSVFHQRGAQGQVVFLMKAEGDRTRDVEMLLQNGLTIPVSFGRDRLAWLLLESNLGGVAELTYTNLRPWAWIGKRMLVLFGPSGTKGLVCINGAVLPVTVPSGQKPVVQSFEDITIAVLNEAQVDAAERLDDGLIVGGAGLDDEDKPLPRAGWSSMAQISSDGGVRHRKIAPVRKGTSPRLTQWSVASTTPWRAGAAKQFKKISEPSSFAELAGVEGYGWFRFNLESAGREKVLFPACADRIHLFGEHERAAVLGVGPGAADDPANLNIEGSTVALVDNLGRFSQGWSLGERKGLWGHGYAVKTLRLARAKVVDSEIPDLGAVGGFFLGLDFARQGPAQALVWKFKPSGRNPIVLDIKDLAHRALVLVNREPIGMVDPLYTGGRARFLLEVGAQITGGQNELRLSLFDEYDGAALHPSRLRMFQCTANLTDGAPWAYAPWTIPPASAFEPIGTAPDTAPRWFRSTFAAVDAPRPLWLDLTGMSKGQIFINGHNAGRYFLTTSTGKKVGPQQRYYLPESWLRTDEANDLVLFDEHGRSPKRCRLLQTDQQST